MTNCPSYPPPSNDVAPDETRCPIHGIKLSLQRCTLCACMVAKLDDELRIMPRSEWFDRALSAHLNHEARKR